MWDQAIGAVIIAGTAGALGHAISKVRTFNNIADRASQTLSEIGAVNQQSGEAVKKLAAPKKCGNCGAPRPGRECGHCGC